MKKLAVIAILFIGSFIGISPANAITCPSGTSVSTVDNTKCISNTARYIPNDRTTLFACPDGATLIDTQCVTPGTIVPAGTYTSTSYHYSPSCSEGIYSPSDQMCHTYLNPPIENAYYSPATSYTYSCSSPNYQTLSGTRCLGTAYGYIGSSISATATGIYPPCSSGGTRDGDLCRIYLTDLLSSPTSIIDGYYCGTTLQSSSSCTTAGYTTQPTYSTPVSTYSSSGCMIYTTFSKTSGYCEPYTFDPSTTFSNVIYKCVTTGWNTTPVTSYYNYDATVVAPFGKSITCQSFGMTTPTDPRDGIYICNAVNTISGNIYFYASEVDATGIGNSVYTTCDFILTEDLTISEDDYIPNYSAPDNCDGFASYNDYIACQLRRYV